jgi:hypothetical protein
VERVTLEPPIGRHPCKPLSKLALASRFLGPPPDPWEVVAGAWLVVWEAATAGVPAAGCPAGSGPRVDAAHATAVSAKSAARPTPVQTRQRRRMGGGVARCRGVPVLISGTVWR